MKVPSPTPGRAFWRAGLSTSERQDCQAAPGPPPEGNPLAADAAMAGGIQVPVPGISPSARMSTSRGLAPSAGPTMPSFSIRSIMRAARL
jgi:hypothetical protein